MVEPALGKIEGRYGSLVRMVITWVMVLMVLVVEVRWSGVGVEGVEEVLMEEINVK